MASGILIVRHPEFQKGFYDEVLDWARANAPQCLEHLDIRDLPLGAVDWPSVRLLVPWLQDPVQAWSTPLYDYMNSMAAHCDSLGVPVVNRVERLALAGKTAGAQAIAAAGLRTPRTVRITDPAAFRRDFAGLAFPLFVREDWGHGWPMTRANTPAEARALPLEDMVLPAASELVDVRDAGDGLHYKYRYLACGDTGVSHHVQASEDWVTRGADRVGNDTTRARELSYISRPDVHHARFQAARRALGLDLVAFDYGYTREGEVVVWEANPFPHIQFAKAATGYRNRAIERSAAAMLAMYMEYARLPVPAAIAAGVAYA